MKIRRFRDEDAQKTSAMIVKTLRTSNAADYPPEIIEALCTKMSPEWILSHSAVDHIYVAEEDGAIVGCGATGPHHGKEDECGLYMIFVSPEYQRRGIGRAIVETLERDELFLRSRRVGLAASITGLGFYLKLGYDFKNGEKELDEDLLYHLEKIRTGDGKIEIKKMETDEETLGKAYVHWKSWHESYSDIVDADWLNNKFSLEKCREIARKYPENNLVAKDGERVVGFAVYGKYIEDDIPELGEINAIYVLEEYQKKKIGYSLMTAVLGELSEYDRIALWVFKDNKKAIDFYEKVGFKPDGTENVFSLGTELTEIRMVYER